MLDSIIGGLVLPLGDHPGQVGDGPQRRPEYERSLDKLGPGLGKSARRSDFDLILSAPSSGEPAALYPRDYGSPAS